MFNLRFGFRVRAAVLLVTLCLASLPAAAAAVPAGPATRMVLTRPASTLLRGDIPARHGFLYLNTRTPYEDGLFSIDLEDGHATWLGWGGATQDNSGLTAGRDPQQLYGSRPAGMTVIDRDGGGWSQLGSLSMSGMAYFRLTDTLYATWQGAFFTVDPATGAKLQDLTPPPPGVNLEALAEDEVHQRVYGLLETKVLGVYDIGADEWSPVGDTHILWNDAGLAYDPVDDVLYAVGEVGTDTVWMIDPHTAEATELGSLEFEGTGHGGLAWVPAALAFAGLGVDGRVHYLDTELFDLGGFTVPLAEPRGLAIDSDRIYVGDRLSERVVAYDYAGTELYSLSTPGIQPAALALVEGDLAAYDDAGSVTYFSAGTGVQGATLSVDLEAQDLTYDYTSIWLAVTRSAAQPNPGLAQRDRLTGEFRTRVSYPSVACETPPTTVTSIAARQLAITCSDGSWYRLASAGGAVAASGHLPQSLTALASVPPAYLGARVTSLVQLDRNMLPLASYAGGGPDSVAGITCDGSLVYAASADAPISPPPWERAWIAVSDLDGKELYRYSWATPYELTGAEWVDGYLALAFPGNGVIEFRLPGSLAVARTIPAVPGTEGLAWDGLLLWQMADQIYGTDVRTGAVVRTLPNPVADCLVNGGGIAAGPPGELIVACYQQRWSRISSRTGEVLGSGNNGLYITGLGRLVPATTHRVYLPLVVR